MPYLQISTDILSTERSERVKNKRGEIKDRLEPNELLKTQQISKITTPIPISGFYSDEIVNFFDIYGGTFTIKDANVDYNVTVYYYKIKNIELINSDAIKKFWLIFQQAYLIHNNILDNDYHQYRMSLFDNELSKSKFLCYDIESHPFCKTQLYKYQLYNIWRILQFHNNGIQVRFDNNMIQNFGNGIFYNWSNNKFISESDIPCQTINGGIVMDEPGTGKTLQFIMYLLIVITEYNLLTDNNRALILVPNDDIKKHWQEEFKKHIIVPLEELPIILLTFTEFNDVMIDKDSIKIVIVDELHMLWSKYKNQFTKLLTYDTKYRWGLTATPFVSENSLMKIIEFLTNKTFENERIAYIPYVQDEIMKIFLKNTKANTKDEHCWPEITIHDVKLTFDKIQQDIYNTEQLTTKGTLNLRLLACQVELMFGSDTTQAITPKDLKSIVISHYKSLYESEVMKYNQIADQIRNIQNHKEQFKQDEYKQRLAHFMLLLENKKSDVDRMKNAFNYYTSSVNKICGVIEANEEEIDPDEKCAICLSPHTPPITYLKVCGHYFCKGCIDYYTKMTMTHIQCPICRQPTAIGDVLIVNEKSEILTSAKCRSIVNIVSSTDDRYIIFSQFPKLIDNLLLILRHNGINSTKFSDYKISENKSEYKVIILSSEDNAAGIDLTEFNNVIIFEPFEDSIYCREIEKQIVGRVHRINQSKNVNVYRMIMLNTIEEQIYSKMI